MAEKIPEMITDVVSVIKYRPEDRLRILREKYPRFSDDFSMDAGYVDLIYSRETGLGLRVYFYHHDNGQHETTDWIDTRLLIKDPVLNGPYHIKDFPDGPVGPLQYERGELHGDDVDWIIAMTDYGIGPELRGVNLINLAADIIAVNLDKKITPED